MAQVYNKLQIDVHGVIRGLATPVQNDANSRFLDVVLLDNGTAINLTGHEVRIYCKKPENGGEIYNNGEITDAVNGRCQFPLTDQTLSKVGYMEAQITIFYENVQILQTHIFHINVVKSLMSDSNIEGSNEYGALVVLFQELYEAKDLMTTMVQNQGEKGTISEDRNIETFWQSIEYMSEYLDTDLTNLLNMVLAEASVQGVIDRLGNTVDTGGTTTAGTAMGKLNSIIDFNWKYQEVQKIKSSATTTIPAPVVSGTQGTVSFGVEFENPVLLSYIGMSLSSVGGGYGDRSYISGSIRITFYDNTTKVFSLSGSQWNYSSYIYIGIFDQVFQSTGGANFAATSYGSHQMPRQDLFIKKVEAVNWYHRNGITDPPATGTCNAGFQVYYKEITKIRG